MLGFKLQPADHLGQNMRTIYRALTSHYGLLGFIIPLMARAEVLIQGIWKQDTG